MYPAGAEWTPAFDMDNASVLADLVVVGMLDSQSNLTIKTIYGKENVGPANKTLHSKDVLSIQLAQAQVDALRARSGRDGPFEVVVFLGQPQIRSAPLSPLWPLITPYPGLVAFDQEGVLVASDDTAKGLLVKSPDYTKASFLEALNYTFYFANQVTESGRSIRKEYDAALVVAVHDLGYTLAKALLAARANVDSCADKHASGRPVITTAVEQCGRNKPNADALEFLGLLLSKGANPNLADKYGITPLMMAERAGSEQAAAMLRKVGASTTDPKDLKTQAAFVRIDAQLMNYVMFYRDLEQTQSREIYSFDKLWKDYDDRSRMYSGRPWQWPQTYRVLANKGVDVLGNPYVLYRNSDEHDVQINPKTIEALSGVVGADYWEGFLPRPGERE